MKKTLLSVCLGIFLATTAIRAVALAPVPPRTHADSALLRKPCYCE